MQHIGNYTIVFASPSLVRVYEGEALVFSGTPGAAYAYCQS